MIGVPWLAMWCLIWLGLAFWLGAGDGDWLPAFAGMTGKLRLNVQRKQSMPDYLMILRCRFFLKLRPMPHCNNPNNINFDFIKKTIWRGNHFSAGKFWKFRDGSSGFREALKPS
jgi:hypothetical protein